MNNKDLAKIIRNEKSGIHATMDSVMEVLDLYDIDVNVATILANTVLEHTAQLVEKIQLNKDEIDYTEVYNYYEYESNEKKFLKVKQLDIECAKYNAIQSIASSRYRKTVVNGFDIHGNLIDIKDYNLGLKQ